MAYGSSDDDDLYASEGSHSDDDTCGEAVMAAMQAISDHCGTEGTPIELPSGQVMMVPDEALNDLRNMAPGSMSDEEVMEIVQNSPWMSGVVERNCDLAGLDPGSRGYDKCVINYARDLMGSV